MCSCSTFSFQQFLHAPYWRDLSPCSYLHPRNKLFIKIAIDCCSCFRKKVLCYPGLAPLLGNLSSSAFWGWSFIHLALFLMSVKHYLVYFKSLGWGNISCSFPTHSRPLLCVSVRSWIQEILLPPFQGQKDFALSLFAHLSETVGVCLYLEAGGIPTRSPEAEGLCL